jgi:LPXTG-motif cell wall-anchored protein
VSGQGENETPQSGVQGETETSPSETPSSPPSASATPGPTQEASAGQLPFTGINAWWLVLLGGSLAGTGIVLRRVFTS